ncbi:hypothetical protein [Burkholderia pseudomallei]|uniref:hypothetical protein n=1 Tax=Burkholderia pseudomallei TaxID=28450 RepID=UPI00097808AB|nr:hypothetical protein [Burkholderia pseudomallei]OMS16872.1 hypothetical protein AQ736_23810 [Burkholderia pseudomallei]OMS96459.1 hypothetical protein AQ750_04800 [Burkholderia pseudomallei]OMV27136.1 hypothetical protein AQ787_14025 [Burkholderia pseudomallei]CAJ3483375.1 Uncharacterised protein [Burkholderia pseudomallei]CAJ4172077.1 Uncharacterised protein [Burkholderia pseudomallei]
MNFEEAKKKALARVREKGLDWQLIAAFLETKHYAAWNTNQTNQDWNIGLQDIGSAEVEPQYGRRDALMNSVVATLDGVRFQLTGSLLTTCMPDGELYTSQTVWLHIGETCVLEGHYALRAHDACIPEQFNLVSVDEYHEGPELESLLARIAELIEQKQRRTREAQQKAQAEKYSGKFTFRD